WSSQRLEKSPRRLDGGGTRAVHGRIRHRGRISATLASVAACVSGSGVAAAPPSPPESPPREPSEKSGSPESRVGVLTLTSTLTCASGTAMGGSVGRMYWVKK